MYYLNIFIDMLKKAEAGKDFSEEWRSLKLEQPVPKILLLNNILDILQRNNTIKGFIVDNRDSDFTNYVNLNSFNKNMEFFTFVKQINADKKVIRFDEKSHSILSFCYNSMVF